MGEVVKWVAIYFVAIAALVVIAALAYQLIEWRRDNKSEVVAGLESLLADAETERDMAIARNIELEEAGIAAKRAWLDRGGRGRTAAEQALFDMFEVKAE